MTSGPRVTARSGALDGARGGVIAALLLAVAGCSPGSAGMSTSDLPGGSPLVQAALDFDYYRQNVEPILMRNRDGFVAGQTACVNCHTWQATTPMKLAPLQTEGEQVYWTESQSRQNFAVISRLVRPGDADLSRFLLKPLAGEAGGNGDNHTGGAFWTSKEDPEWQVLAEWVESAPTVPLPTPARAPDFTFFRQCVQPIFINPVPNAIACAECHSGNGARSFANRYPEGRDAWTEEESERSYAALMNLIEAGHPEYSRFLHHPLHIDAGGDFMHNGGRRWMSKQDPEWQALAQWIRGDLSGPNCPEALQF